MNTRFLRSLAPSLIVILGGLCYANSFSGDFVYDDLTNVAGNPAIRRLWPAYGWLGYTPTRLLGYFTFAVNYALHGRAIFGYHVVNLVIHLATALALYGLIRRTLRTPPVAERYRTQADVLAGAVALLWVVHPLCTQAVTYVYQRLESLAALLAVLACYAFVRAYENVDRPRRAWIAASLVFVYAALVTKESVYGLPVILLIYDRLFVGGSWRGLLRRRRYHAAAFCSWGVAIGLMTATGSQYAEAGIGHAGGPTPLAYALSQSGVLLYYLQLSVWPANLCLDRTWPIAREWSEFVPQTMLVLALLGIVGYGLARGRLWSFPGWAFFLLLAPTSSLLPIADLMFEHRMYLPLAVVLVYVVCGGFELQRRFATRVVNRRWIQGATVCMFSGVVVALAGATHARNRVYHSELDLLHDGLVNAPHNARTYYLLGNYYLRRHRDDEALENYRRTLAIAPDFTPARIKQADLMVNKGHYAEAESLLRDAVVANDGARASLHTEFGVLRIAQGRADEAMQHYVIALDLNPANAQAMTNLGILLMDSGRAEEAVSLYRQAAEIAPDDAAPRNNLGIDHFRGGRFVEAEAEFREALLRDVDNVEARSNLGATLDRLGRTDEALDELNRAVAADESYVGGRINLGTVLARRGRFDEAVVQYRQALRLQPDNREAATNLAQALSDR